MNPPAVPVVVAVSVVVASCWRLLLGLCLVLGLSAAFSVADAQATLTDRTLSDNEAGTPWKLEFPASMGHLTAPVTFGGNTYTYVGAGPAVFALSPGGEVVGRADLPGVVTALDTAGGAVRVSTQGAGYTEHFTLGTPENNLHLPVAERAVMPPDPAVTGWLAQVADAAPDQEVSRLARNFPANPFLALREAQQYQRQKDNYAALSSVRRALGVQMPFPAWTTLAARLDTAGFPAAADLALERAKRDAAQRGLDPEIPVGREVLKAYGDPAGYAASLIEQNRLERAAVWMGFLRELYPRFEGYAQLYERYAALLGNQGRPGEAEQWRQFSRSLRGGSLYNLGSEDTSILRDAARLASLTLLLSLLLALATLAARAWRVQGEDMGALGGRYGSVWRRPMTRARLNLMSYASFSERGMLVTLGAALLLSLVGWQWANQTARGLRAAALNLGTYGGGWYATQLGNLNLRVTPDTALLSGLSAQLDGDGTTARESFLQAGQDACALNNLGVISHDREDEPQALELYRAALAQRSDLSAAQYNLGLGVVSPGTAFQKTYRPDEPRLCYLDRRNVARMVSGDLISVLRRDLSDPRSLLRGEGRLGWAILAALLHLGLLLFLLLVPRAATSQRLGRPPLYRLLAFLVPGAGLLGSPWGGVLLVTWAGLAAALLPSTGLLHFPYLGVLTEPTTRNLLLLGLLGTYLVNTLTLSLIEARFLRKSREGRAAQVG